MTIRVIDVLYIDVRARHSFAADDFLAIMTCAIFNVYIQICDHYLEAVT